MIQVAEKVWNGLNQAIADDKTIISLQGSSRCFAPDTLVRMADGRTNAIANIKVGDRVMNMEGNGFNTVIDIHNGIDEMYCIKQARGVDYIVNSNHILALRQSRKKSHKVAIPGYLSKEKRRIEMLPFDQEKIYNIDIKEYKTLSNNLRLRYTGFKNTMVNLPETELPIDPYYLGLWLGDGCSIRPYDITNVDKEILSYFYEFAKSLGSYAYQVDKVTHRIQVCEEGKRGATLKGKTREFRDEFKKLNIIGNKHIPDEYIYNSYNNRMKLLAGLIDTDGNLTKGNTYVIVQKRRCILDAVLEISRLSGFYSSGIREQVSRMKREDGSVYECVTYKIEINHGDFNGLIKYIRTPRKKVVKRCGRNYFSTTLSIEPIGVGRYCGFELDNSPYFLLQDGTVAHNSAKTYSVVIFLIISALQNPNTRISVVRKTLPALKGSVLIDFKDIMDRMQIWEPKQFNKTELIYKLYNGSWFEFFSTDDEQKIRGRKRDILFANEANEISYLEWQQLIMRTTKYAILDYNPSFSEDHWIEQINKDPDTYHFISTYKDNPFLEQKIKDDIEKLKDKNKSLWTVYGLGLRAVIEGRIFDDYEMVDEIPEWIKKRWVGMDFGYTNDPTAIIEVALHEYDLYLDEICYRTRMLTNDIIGVLKRECQDKKIISESADPRLIDEIHNAGVNIHAVEKFQGSIMAGLTKMQEYHIKITKRSIHIKKEIDNYVYDQDKDGRYLNQPVDEFNHAIDASRYVILEEVIGKNRKKISIQQLSDMLPI